MKIQMGLIQGTLTDMRQMLLVHWHKDIAESNGNLKRIRLAKKRITEIEKAKV